ncbi:heterokaryon incompatibility protein-domain-containing protein [Cadophora sp. MPI-SDFR-AT-0126]|nr:heterokaryon incompatibility protein-domain-containing protein [Leotiomycetes sp. MPI-SDFR-AT-0126]
MTDPSKPIDNWNSSHFYRMEAWPVKSLPRHYDPTSSADISGIPQLTGLNLMDHTSTHSPKAQALAKSWLSQCKNNKDGKHQECNKRDSDYIPTRLLDIRHAQLKSRLRLVCSELVPEVFIEDREWMTLSHCWGEWGAKENPILVKNNLKERQETGLEVADLPKTFQDAIEIAGWFGINWLWIDCLCIIQDSQEDWLNEARMMSQIYQNAQLNVSADTGADSRAGCFIERDEVDITPLQIGCPQISKTWMVLPDVMHMFDWMLQATSLSRAWIHRERQLARRVLHFTAGELVWECCGIKGTAFASETLPVGAPFENGLFNMDHKYQIGRLQQGLLEGDEETYATWNDICENLSEKKLTKPSDMPMVLSGLAKDFSNALPGDKYIAGLWRSTLPHSLLWNARLLKDPDLEFIAPSWSWLSTGAAVKLANRSSITAKHPIATILNEIPRSNTMIHMALWLAGIWRLRGFLGVYKYPSQIQMIVRKTLTSRYLRTTTTTMSMRYGEISGIPGTSTLAKFAS